MSVCALSGELRPEPGSRVNLNPATTQGAGVPVFGAPVKGTNHTCNGARWSLERLLPPQVPCLGSDSGTLATPWASHVVSILAKSPCDLRKQRRIQYPPSVSNPNKPRSLREGVTKP
jgi:hypothetical protein